MSRLSPHPRRPISEAKISLAWPEYRHIYTVRPVLAVLLCSPFLLALGVLVGYLAAAR